MQFGITPISEGAFATLTLMAEQVRDGSGIVPTPLFEQGGNWVGELVELVNAGYVNLVVPGAVTVTRLGIELVTARSLSGDTRAA